MKLQHKISLVALLFMLPYVLGWLFPEPWWATHHLAFMQTPWNYIILITSFLLLGLSVFLKPKLAFHIRQHWIVSLAISVVFGALCYGFPVAVDIYGNARSLIPFMDKTVTELPDNFISDLFHFELASGNGRWGVFHAFTCISYVFGATYKSVFIWVNAICGGLFVFTWLLWIKTRITDPMWRATLSIAGVASPFFLIFFGHIETYAPLYLIMLWYLILLAKQLENRNAYLLIPITILLIVSIRFHNLMNMMLITYLLAVLHQFAGTNNWIRKLEKMKGLLVWIFTPICIAGLILYFFILGDHKDPRFLDGGEPDIERLFLPIISPEPPLDKYNLQSWNHIFDYINAILHWSPAVLFLVTVCLVFYRKKLRGSIALNTIALGLLVFMTFFFVFNPLMSMPIDWDLLVFPTPMLMVIAVLMVEKVQYEQATANLTLTSLAIAVLTIPLFVVNASRSALSYRMEKVGVHIYKTYYAHSSTRLLEALGMIPDNLELYMERKQNLIKELEPYAQPGVDRKYAELLADNAIIKWRNYNQLEAAKADFQRALYYSPDYHDNWVSLAMINLELDNPKAAHQNILQVANIEEYSNSKLVLELLIRSAIGTGKYDEAAKYSETYLNEFGQDEFLKSVFDTIEQAGLMTPPATQK